MSLYHDYPVHVIVARRVFAVVAKTSDKPVWMDQAEKVACDFY